MKNISSKPPSDVDAEKYVLASILLDKEALIKVADILTSEDFYDPVHQIIFDAALNLFHSSIAVDIVTVRDFLVKHKKIDKLPESDFLAEIVSILPITTNVEFYCNIIKEASLRRKLISLSSDLVRLGLDESRKVPDIIDEVEKRIFTIFQNTQTKDFTHIRDLILQISEKFEGNIKDVETLRGISSGFASIDNLIGGLHKGDLIIIAARPSVGKTAFMLEMVRKLSVYIKKKVLIFSLEMSKDQVADRLLSLQSEVSLMDIRIGNLEGKNWDRCKEAMEELYEADIFIDDTPGLHISELRTKARKWNLEVGLDAIFVDYLQLLQGRNKDNRALEVSEISQGLKNIARELRLPVIALSQLNRSVESRNDRRPQLSDLRESGAIEQDADIVIFLHREAYYNRELDESEKNKAEAIVAKNRNGATGIANLRFVDYCAKFIDDNE
ncbi:MAG: replicative DNA helicase [Candidatus Dojkabacteria bacterium]|nr:MAG: replicative DNA helicase [Candidatus Dojkabacteria bacterium]